MKKILLITLFVLALSSCGTLRVREADRKLVSEGKKSLLVTQNFDLSDSIMRKMILDTSDNESFDIKQSTVNIISIDGKEVVGKWYRANEEVAIEPGRHKIVAEYTVETKTKNDPSSQSGTQTIDYLFEGGKRYRIYAFEHFDNYEIRIEPY
jgi:hypothetical protein